ncbi:MAG: SHD1 domain-containing protein, partial [Planctomycetota bacterium]
MSTSPAVCAATRQVPSPSRPLGQTAAVLMMAGVLLLLSITHAAAFQRPGKSAFKKGEKVEVEWHFDWYPGEIVSVEPTGWLKAKFKDKEGRDQEWTLPPNKFRKPMNAKPAGKAGAKGENPFDNGEASKPRTWTDATGKFKVEATFTELKDDTVHLKKTDGSPLKVPLEKLSEADQKVAKQFAAGGGDGNSESPFQADEEMSAEGKMKVVEADWSSVEAVPFDDVRAAVPSDAVKLSAEIKPRRVMLQARPNNRNDAIFESVRRIGFHAESASAIVTHVFAPPGGTAVSRVERCDLNTGKSLGSVELQTAAVPYDVSPDGKLLLCVNEWPGKEKNIEVWGINGKELENVISFLPTDMASFHKDNLNTNDAGYIDNEHIWTLDSMGKMVVWQLRKAKAIYAVTLPLNSRPAFSPGRNYFALSLPTGVFVLESATGKTTTKLDGYIGIVGTANFSDDGKRLAVVSPALVKVFNLETGKSEHEVFFPRQFAGSSVNFLGDNYV